MDGDIIIEALAAEHVVEVVDEPATLDILVVDSGQALGVSWPLTHPTLANTQIGPVANGFQFVVEGVTILTMTKDGINYG